MSKHVTWITVFPLPRPLRGYGRSVAGTTSRAMRQIRHVSWGIVSLVTPGSQPGTQYARRRPHPLGDLSQPRDLREDRGVRGGGRPRDGNPDPAGAEVGRPRGDARG